MVMIRRGIVKEVDDSDGLQRLQIALGDGEVIDRAIRLQGYGFSSVPHTGVQVALPAGADVVMGLDDREHRPTGLKPGEVILYDARGSRIYLKANGALAVTAKSLAIKNDTGELVTLLADILGDLLLAKVGNAPVVYPRLALLKTKLESFVEKPTP